MKKLLTLLVIFTNSYTFACTDTMQIYSIECSVQEKFQKLELEFKKKSIDPNHLNGNFLSFAVSDRVYNKNKNELLHNQETLQLKNQIQSMLKVENLIKRNLTPFLSIDELNKYHALFSSPNKSIINLDFTSDKFRTFLGQTNPKANFSCEDQVLTDNTISLLNVYDLQTIDSYPLLEITNIKNCDKGYFVSGDIVFYKGPSVKNEMNRWLNELNDTVRRYKNNQQLEIAPYTYLSDMYRWFIAIHPYMEFNENVGKAALMWAAFNLKIPIAQINDQVAPYLKVAGDSRNLNADKLNRELDFLNACLYEYADQKVSDECREITLQ